MGIVHDAPHGHRRTTPDRRFRIITVVMVPVPGGFPGPSALPCSLHVHKVAPSARRVGRWGCPAPTPYRSHLVASGLTRPDLATTTPPYVYQVCPRALSVNSPAGSPPLRFAPFRPALQGQRLRLGPDHRATVAPLSLRSFVRPHHRAALRTMSLGPGDCAALVNGKGIRREETLPANAGRAAPSLFIFVIRRIHNV